MISEELIVTKPFLKECGEIYKRAFRPFISGIKRGSIVKITTSIDNHVSEQKLILTVIGCSPENLIVNSNIVIDRDIDYNVTGKISNFGTSEVNGVYVQKPGSKLIIYLEVDDISYVACDIISILNNSGKNLITSVEILEDLDTEPTDNRVIGSIGDATSENEEDIVRASVKPTEFIVVKYDPIEDRKEVYYSTGYNDPIDNVYSSHVADTLKSLGLKVVSNDIKLTESSYESGVLSANLEVPAFYTSGRYNLDTAANSNDNIEETALEGVYRMGSLYVSKEGLIVNYRPEDSPDIPTATETERGLIKIGYNNTGKPETLPVKLNNKDQAYVDVSSVIDTKHRWNLLDVIQNPASEVWYNRDNGFIFEYIGANFTYGDTFFLNGYFYQCTKSLSNLEITSSEKEGWTILTNTANKLNLFVQGRVWSNGLNIDLNTDYKLTISKYQVNSETGEVTWMISSLINPSRSLEISNSQLESIGITCNLSLNGTVIPLSFSLINANYTWSLKNVQPAGDGFDYITIDDIDDMMNPVQSFSLTRLPTGGGAFVPAGEKITFTANILPKESVQKVTWSSENCEFDEITNTTCVVTVPQGQFKVTATHYDGVTSQSLTLIGR